MVNGDIEKKFIFGAENDREQRADRPTQHSGIVFFIIASDRERMGSRGRDFFPRFKVISRNL